ncbi:MAG: VOC family protein [Acidimicrobiia bacterium]
MTALRQVAQRAEDLDRAVTFYRDILGLRLIARFDPPVSPSSISMGSDYCSNEEPLAPCSTCRQMT